MSNVMERADCSKHEYKLLCDESSVIEEHMKTRIFEGGSKWDSPTS